MPEIDLGVSDDGYQVFTLDGKKLKVDILEACTNLHGILANSANAEGKADIVNNDDLYNYVKEFFAQNEFPDVSRAICLKFIKNILNIGKDVKKNTLSTPDSPDSTASALKESPASVV